MNIYQKRYINRSRYYIARDTDLADVLLPTYYTGRAVFMLKYEVSYKISLNFQTTTSNR